MTFAVGSLVKARGREWVVLPESADDLLMLRPLGGTEDEVTGVYIPLETVESATFALPNPDQVGDHNRCRLLRDALRLGFRSSAGPFRSFAHLAVEPRPYQLVPLLMALKLDPVRVLIADDVGIGKTVEASLILRELLDRGEVQRFAIICPPHLAEQWQAELREKFHIDAELVLPSTAARLERYCGVGQTIFDVYKHVIVSMDFIKTQSRRDDFIRTCPELVIVDEAHTCAQSEGKGKRHQRYHLVSKLAEKRDRHMILVTATPHSGKEEAFRSLLKLLNPEFEALPDDMSGAHNEQHRRRLAAHFIQRRRADIRAYLDSETPFPDREDAEESYKLSADYKRLFNQVLQYAGEIVKDESGGRHRQRVRWWSALALLRSLASSPAAAAATLRTRAANVDADNEEVVDDVGLHTVMDLADGEGNDGFDAAPGANIYADEGSAERNRLLTMAQDAEALCGDKDEKLLKAIKLVDQLLKDGFRPIVFCRFIPTAEYLAEEMRKRLKKVEVVAVTGLLPPAEREARVMQLAESENRVLVATDCLSEGINLQSHFDAVLHYDLSWNPTRHEQREGRVDRYGQKNPKVRVLTYYGIDNQIDGLVLDVLIRKHRSIRSSLGISVPVPVDSESVVEAIFEGLLLRSDTSKAEQLMLLPNLTDYLKPQKEALHIQWDQTTEKEKRSQTMFAQHTIKVDEVARELDAVRAAIGSGVDVATFTKDALRMLGAVITEGATVGFEMQETPLALRELMGIGNKASLRARFDLPVADGELYLNRTHPVVEGLASYVLDTALDDKTDGVARRCGVIRTAGVERRTTVLLTRFRFHIITKKGDETRPLLAEDCRLLAFAGSPQSAEWLIGDEAERLLAMRPDGNVTPEQASEMVGRVVSGFEEHLLPRLNTEAERLASEILDAHKRVREDARLKGVSYEVEPQLPPDVLGVYVFLPKV